MIGAAQLAALAAVFAGAAQASTSDVPNLTVSPNWSGYVATGPAGSPVSYSSVTGTWTVPTATCALVDAGSFSTIWVGLGGYTTQKMEEVGTDANCDAAGKPTYYAWFELVPYPGLPDQGQGRCG